ncbi:cysteinyl-tRNA synthetase [Pilibacter termitis]|uniref:Cysteine--tRNA ligase n=1 Tax=Pilibacter termitis TaxID=263852 RepID=A0A1T4LZE8_9ENTE|nr:cysteine--tRNA ligase [Pilibacter termitis]SJZ60036.1 cysteinyl-tRNA synthetase [Pilibacter termitis]
MKLYNTMTRQKEVFVPIEEGKVRMYVCGPTVYNYIHIGNARSTVAFDVIRRFLEYRGYEVNYVSNFTDVDDKIIQRAKEEQLTPEEIAEKYIQAFRKDVGALNVLEATSHPRVVENMDDIISFIEVLIEKGFAYESSGDVYFRARKSENYGALANKTIDDLEIGAGGRVGEEANRKEDPIDFALWKQAKEGEISWRSPWGDGRPGWHIECSVMATKFLGETIDIHGGGSDLEFPHHTNEIAQSEAKTGKKFANYWLHNGFVTIGEDDEKMSKSLGNFVTAHELLKRVDPQIVRFLMSTTQYRRPIRFSETALLEAEVNLNKLKNSYHNFTFREESLVESLASDDEKMSELIRLENRFIAEMEDDFNAANGVSVFYELATWMNKTAEETAISEKVYAQTIKIFLGIAEVFGLTFTKEENSLDEEIERLIEERNLARKNRDFARSDEIRDTLASRGIVLEDTANGTRWKVVE